MLRRLFLISLIGLCSGCYPARNNHGRWSEDAITCRTGKEVYWYQDCCREHAGGCLVQQLLSSDLSADSAVQIALLNNASLQAKFEEIGIAHADLVQATLLTNPVFEGLVKIADRSTRFPNTEFTLTTFFLDLFLRPLRMKTAELNLQETEAKTAHEALQLVFEVQSSFYRYQTALAKLESEKVILECTELASEIAKKQRETGNINDLILQDHIAEYQRVQQRVKNSEIEIVVLKEDVTRLLGLNDSQYWNVMQEIHSLPSQDSTLSHLETAGLQSRLDLAAARIQILKIAQTGALKQWWTFTELELGATTERDTDGTNITGPVVQLSIPIFDNGQAERARILAELRHSQREYQALETNILSEIREAQDRIQMNREKAKLYQSSILPTKNEMLTYTHKLYNVMNVGVYELLHQKREIVESEIEYREALRDYWIERAALLYATGGAVCE